MERKKLHHLAQELLLRISESLSPPDLSNFRLTCRALASAGGSVLLHPNKLSRLYIHPTSVSRFIEICGDETFATNIHQIVLLGKTSDHYEHSEYNHLNNHPWPHFLTSNPGRAPSLIELVRSENTPFDVAYKDLVTAISKLSNVRTVTYAAEADKPGLNMTSRTAIDDCTASHADYGKHFDPTAATGPQTRKSGQGSGEETDTRFQLSGQSSSYPKRMVRWSDVSVLTSILLHAPTVDRVEVGRATYACKDIDDHRLIPSTNTSTSVFCLLQRKLKSISFCLGNGAFKNEYNLYATTLLAKCTGIESVTVYIDADGKRIDSDMNRQSLRGCRYLISLRKLEIIGIGATPCVLDVGQHPLSTAGALMEDLLNFLLQHGTRLTSIRLANVVLTKPYGKDARRGMREGLTLLKQHLVSLDEASLRLQRVSCSAECPGFVGSTVGGLCCLADPTNGQAALRRFRASDIEEIAKEFDCPERDGMWEFGDYLMRKNTK